MQHKFEKRPPKVDSGTPWCDGQGPMKSPDLIPTRESLLSRLRDLADDESWQDFFNTYWRLIYEVALKTGITEAEAQEVVQETLISVAKSMPDFRYDRSRGSFKGWLLQITRRRISDLVRKRMQNRAGGAHIETLASDALETVADPSSCDLENIWDAEWEKHLFNTAARNVRKKVRPEHYQLFDLAVVQKWPVRKVASVLGVSVGQVYLAKHRVRLLLKKELHRLELETR